MAGHCRPLQARAGSACSAGQDGRRASARATRTMLMTAHDRVYVVRRSSQTSLLRDLSHSTLCTSSPAPNAQGSGAGCA